jgi:hypothetical protein
VTEGQFWKELRARMNRLAQENGDRLLPGHCEWLEQKSYATNGRSARITGRALIDGRIRSVRWRFTLVLNHAIASFEEFDWAGLQGLLPNDDETNWLSVDGERLTIELPSPCRDVD